MTQALWSRGVVQYRDPLASKAAVYKGCLAEAAQHLRAPGMIVFDDSNRARYSVGLSNQPLTLRRFRGLGPTVPYLEETSLLDYADVEDS